MVRPVSDRTTRALSRRILLFKVEGRGWGIHISLVAILEGIHISLVLCVRGYTYHGDTHITVTTVLYLVFLSFPVFLLFFFHLSISPRYDSWDMSRSCLVVALLLEDRRCYVVVGIIVEF